MRRSFTWAGGLAISGVVIWLGLRGVDLGQTGDALREAEYWPLAPALGLLALANWVRAYRWKALFASSTQPPIGPLTRAMLIGQFFNAILPIRAGDAARVIALHREVRTSRAESLATAFAERVYDIFAVLVLLLAAAPFLPRVSWLGKAAVVAAVFAAAIVVVVVVLVRWGERPLVWLLRQLGRLHAIRLERAERAAVNLTAGLASFHRPRVALRVFSLTVLAWLTLALSAWLLLLGFDLDVGYRAGLLVTIATALAAVLPAAPGGVGTVEAATIVALSAFDVSRPAALSYAVVYHAVNLVPYLVAGWISMQRHAVHVRRRRTDL